MSQYFDIIQVTPDDLDDLMCVEREVFLDLSASRETMLERMRSYPAGTWGAVRGGRMIGFVNSFRVDLDFAPEEYSETDVRTAGRPDGAALYVASLNVLPRERGQGIGTSLMRHILARAHDDGMKRAVLVASRLSAPLYARLGFSRVKELPGFMHTPHPIFPDPVLMEREISGERM
ncbi:MAG: GNAT family N-acetyltransferase [Bacillota bacterium]